MERLKKFLSASRLNVVIFVLAASLVLAATIGAASATIVYLAETYGSEVDMAQIGVTLMENGNDISRRDYTGKDDSWVEETGTLLENMLTATGGELKMNHQYEEQLSVRNSGSIDVYVKVTIYQYWEDKNGTKIANVDPLWPDMPLCDLNIPTGKGWIEDVNARTTERTVLIYQYILEAGDSTQLFADTICFSGNVAGIFDENRDYVYNGARFVLRVDVDAVQVHNAEGAIQSAWGINMSDFGMQQP